MCERFFNLWLGHYEGTPHEFFYFGDSRGRCLFNREPVFFGRGLYKCQSGKQKSMSGDRNCPRPNADTAHRGRPAHPVLHSAYGGPKKATPFVSALIHNSEFGMDRHEQIVNQDCIAVVQTDAAFGTFRADFFRFFGPVNCKACSTLGVTLQALQSDPS